MTYDETFVKNIFHHYSVYLITQSPAPGFRHPRCSGISASLTSSLCFRLRQGYGLTDRRTSRPASSIEYSQRINSINRFPSVVDVELAVDVDGVSFYGLRGNEELFGDLLVAHPLCQQDQYLKLAVR